MLPVFLFVTHADANSVLKQVVSKHLAMTSGSVFVREGNSNALPIKVTFSPKGGRAWLPNQTIVEASATKMRFYDDIFGQVATAEARTAAHPEKDLVASAVVHRGAMAFLIDDGIKKDFLTTVSKIPGWKLAGRTLKATDRNKGVTMIQFDSQNRITRLTVTQNKKPILDNIFEHVSDSQVPRIPSTAKVKPALQARPQVPITTSPKIMISVFAVWRSMSRLGAGSVKQVSDSGKFETQFGPGMISEKGGAKPWSFSGGKLTVSGSTKPVSASMALDNLKAIGVYVSPISRYLMNGQIPFLDIFNRADKISDGPSISVDGKMSKIINLERSGNRIRLYADAASNRIVMVSNETRDRRGNWITASRLKLIYR
ncbi:MAG: hypothetical protein WCK51_12175 [Armatimonadota bacterium]